MFFIILFMSFYCLGIFTTYLAMNQEVKDEAPVGFAVIIGLLWFFVMPFMMYKVFLESKEGK